jgi:[ribosomal protein S18]-alanine N-acetyltransferase
MGQLEFSIASAEEKKWAAVLLSGSEPWISLGISPERIHESCYNPDHDVYIAQHQGKACGVIIVHPNGLAGSPYIKSIAVDTEFRNMGIGTALIHHTEGLFKTKARYLFLCVSSFNNRAQALYEKLGFTVVGELKDYIIDGASEILMSKRLA